MLIISQNLTNFDIPLPKNCIFRINLAWVNDLDVLKTLLLTHKSHEIFLDLPVGRTKPPNNKYTINDLIPILNNSLNIKYFAISNVNSSYDLKPFLDIIPSSITIVPKIESPQAVTNIDDIVNSLPNTNKIIMLDHDDLYSALIKQNHPPSKFKDYFYNLVEFCNSNNVTLLRTIGVVFSDQEKRVTQYMK